MSEYVIIFGTRPEYLKLKPIIDEFQKRKINHKVIYVKQHVNINEDMNTYYQELSIDDNGNDRLSCIGQQILLKLPDYIKTSTHIIVQGDTATAFYSAIIGFQLQKQIIHFILSIRSI